MDPRALLRLPGGIAVSLLLALLAALFVSYSVSLAPPRLTPRALEMASASTEVLVDTPAGEVGDLRQDLFQIEGMTSRAVWLGNVMASAPVLEYIGRRAGVPPDRIRATTPRTPDAPRALASPGSERKASDLIRSTGQYRLDIEANPSVPILKIYAQAPTAKASGELANAAVDGLRDYLGQAGELHSVRARERVRLEQLGRAHGAAIGSGARLQLAILSFLLVFAVAFAASAALGRVRRGFLLGGTAEPPSDPGDDDVDVPEPTAWADLAVR